MDPQRRNDRLPTGLYALVGIMVCGGLFAAYGWFVQRWGGLVILLEVGVVVVAVIVGVVLSLRKSRG